MTDVMTDPKTAPAAAQAGKRRKGGWEETDKLNLPATESIPEFPSTVSTQTQLYFENGVLAFKVFEQGTSVVVIYKVDRNGQLHRVARLTAPDDPQHVGWGCP